MFRGLDYQVWDLTLPLPSKKLSRYLFIGAGRRHETLCQRQRTLLIAQQGARSSLCVSSHEGNTEGPDGWLHTQWAAL